MASTHAAAATTTCTAPDPFKTWRKVQSIIKSPGAAGGPWEFKFTKNQKIEHALEETSSVVACNGRVQRADSFFTTSYWEPLFVDLSEDEKNAASTQLQDGIMPVDALIKVADPAPFGREGETVFDESVRKAMEIPASRIPEDLKDWVLDRFVGHDRDKWESCMKPPGKRWEYQLYKIHMYGPGGKFNKHVDTLHTENHVATLIVCLPSEHKGGELRIEHLGSTRTVDFSGRARDDDLLEFAAFFTDCTHEVLPVTEGWRVVVQYDVYEKADEWASSGDEDEEANSSDSEHAENAEQEYASKWGRMLMTRGVRRFPKEPLFHDPKCSSLVEAVNAYLPESSDHALGFFLRHRYSLPSLEMQCFKGLDRHLFDALVNSGFDVSVCGVVVHLVGDDDSYCGGYTGLSLSSLPSPFCEVESDSDMESERNKKPKRSRSERERVHLVVDKRMATAEFLHRPEETGNEPGEGYLVYRSACLIVRRICAKAPAAKLTRQSDE
jgi:2OG-Fe(II) oxygenase superfamily